MLSANLLLPEIVITDWLCKLGEPAFMAWLRLRIWRERGELNISMRQLIKKLDVANSTFYKKILPVLWEHGLVDIIQPDRTRRCSSLIVYDTPEGLTEKATLPLERIRTYSSSLSCCITDCSVSNIETLPHETVPKNETLLHETVPINETFQISEHPLSYLDNQDLLKEDKEKEIKETKQIKDQIDRSSFSSSLSSLPQELQIAIQNNTRLHNHISAITELYEQFYTRHNFSLSLFIKKMNLSIEKVKIRSAYKKYFQKTLLNLWGSIPTTRGNQHAHRRTNDLPEWIIRQEERRHAHVVEESQEIPLETKLEIDRLMKELDLCAA